MVWIFASTLEMAPKAQASGMVQPKLIFAATQGPLHSGLAPFFELVGPAKSPQ